jgi:hypothetical protein
MEKIEAVSNDHRLELKLQNIALVTMDIEMFAPVCNWLFY